MKDGKKLSPGKAALIEQLELIQMEIAIAEHHKEEYKKQAKLQRSIRRA